MTVMVVVPSRVTARLPKLMAKPYFAGAKRPSARRKSSVKNAKAATENAAASQKGGADAESPIARLTLFGSFALTDAQGVALAVPAKKNRALLAILALSPRGTATRERLYELLWGDRGEQQARSSLRQSLAVLRKELRTVAQVLGTTGDQAYLDLKKLGVDVLEFETCAGSTDPVSLGRAAHLYADDLLADVLLREPAFERWLGGERQRLAELAILVFERLSAMGPSGARVAHAKRLVALDPFREASHRALMTAFHDAGEIAHAVQQFESCEAILKSELGVSPAPETLQLRARISGSATLQLPDRPSVAVLPFRNASGDPDQALFSDGISEDIIAHLSRFRSLFVVSRASSFAVRSEGKSPRLIGQELGVRFILDGSVRQAAGNIRVFAELVDASTGMTLWTQNYDRPSDYVFSLIDELTTAIVASSVGKIEDELLRQFQRKSTGGFAAYEFMLRGRMLMRSPGPEMRLAARQMFEQAIALDPGFSKAHVYLALSYLNEFFFDDSGAALERAIEIATQSLLNDQEEAGLHMVLGLAHLHRRRFELSLQHCERAVHLNPSDPELAAKLGLVLVDMGRPDEAIPHIDRAMRLNPLHPEVYSDYLALAHFGARRYREAIAAMQAVPDTVFYYHVWLAAIRVHLGELDRAIEHRKRALDIAPDFTIDRFAAREPIMLPADLAHWTDALRIAGFK